MKNASALLLFLACLNAPAHAQSPLAGTYTGTYDAVTRSGTVRPLGIALTVTSVEDNVVKGVGKRILGACAGEYPMEGKLENGTLVMRATEKGGGAGDCSLRFKLNVEGNKLVGTVGNTPVQMSR